MTLVCMVALVEYYHVKLFYFDEPVHQSVVKFFLCEHEHVKAGELVLPVFVLEFSRHHFLGFLVMARVLAYSQICVPVDSLSLLLNQVSGRD